MNCIYVIQKKVVRIIHHEERLAHMNCLFKQMHSLKFQDLVKYRTAIIMFNLYYGKLPTLLQSRFKRSENIHNTRSRNTFIVIKILANKLESDVYIISLGREVMEGIASKYQGD